MKKMVALLTVVLSLTACGKYEEEAVPLSDLGSAVAYAAGLREYRCDSLKDMDIAAAYGIAPQEIREGIVYYSTREGCTDKVILVISQNHDGLRNVEHALETHINMLALAYRYDREESTKIEQHIFKTRGMYTLLALTEDPEGTREVFDGMIS